MKEQARQQVEQAFQRALITRVAMILAVAVYAAVVLIVRRTAPRAAPYEDSATGQLLLYIFTLVSALTIVLMKVLSAKLLGDSGGKRSEGSGQAPLRELRGAETSSAGGWASQVGKFVTETIVVGALGEAIGIYGLVFAMMTGRVAESLAFMGASVVAQLATFPRKDDWIRRIEAGPSPGMST